MKKAILILAGLVVVFGATPAMAITDTQEKAIIDHCDEIRENLKNIQKLDAKTRVYLGGYYETILTKFITPLNVRLVENNMPNVGLVNNQEQLTKSKLVFFNDYISYQQSLEDLVTTNCKSAPKEFYSKLEDVRMKRKVVSEDVEKLREIVANQVKMVKKLEVK